MNKGYNETQAVPINHNDSSIETMHHFRQNMCSVSNNISEIGNEVSKLQLKINHLEQINSSENIDERLSNIEKQLLNISVVIDNVSTMLNIHLSNTEKENTKNSTIINNLITSHMDDIEELNNKINSTAEQITLNQKELNDHSNRLENIELYNYNTSPDNLVKPTKFLDFVKYYNEIPKPIIVDNLEETVEKLNKEMTKELQDESIIVPENFTDIIQEALYNAESEKVIQINKTKSNTKKKVKTLTINDIFTPEIMDQLTKQEPETKVLLEQNPVSETVVTEQLTEPETDTVLAIEPEIEPVVTEVPVVPEIEPVVTGVPVVPEIEPVVDNVVEPVVDEKKTKKTKSTKSTKTAKNSKSTKKLSVD